jgi:hypothetical protein
MSATQRTAPSLPGPGANLDAEIAAYDQRVATAAARSAAIEQRDAAQRQRELSSVGIPEAPEPVPASITPISGIATCPSCGLSLSASARFCRRCGTQQQRSA